MVNTAKQDLNKLDYTNLSNIMIAIELLQFTKEERDRAITLINRNLNEGSLHNVVKSALSSTKLGVAKFII